MEDEEHIEALMKRSPVKTLNAFLRDIEIHAEIAVGHTPRSGREQALTDIKKNIDIIRRYGGKDCDQYIEIGGVLEEHSINPMDVGYIHPKRHR